MILCPTIFRAEIKAKITAKITPFSPTAAASSPRTPLPRKVSASASATAVELCGCALASSAGGLKSICVSLLELCPTSEPRSSACTRSERGGAMPGARFFAGSVFDGAEFAGVFPGRSPGKVVSRLNPEASWLSEEDEGGGEDCGGPCCAHPPALNPKNKPINNQRCIGLFYRLGTHGMVAKNTGRSGGGFERPVWRSPPV